MQLDRTPWRIAALLIALGLPGGPAAAATLPNAADPPTRVGRVALLQGTVSFHTAGEDHWDPAALNYPVTSGNFFWTEPAALAEVQVGSSGLWMNGGTEFDVGTLDDRAVQAVAPQGEVYLHLRDLDPGETYTLQTPRGTVGIAADGRYDIVAGDARTPTRVSVVAGAARISGGGFTLDVAAGQTATVSGTDSFQDAVGPLARDAFLDAMLARERPRATAAVAPPPTVLQMTGGGDLAQYGTWQTLPQYGTVWYPQVAVGWVPYREGQWAYVAPWGWTWVDAAPWGFAPFHYGRWVRADARWCWVPGHAEPDHDRPVYAPALVSFFGLGAVAAVGVGVGEHIGLGRGPAFRGGDVGWVPLGPREAYDPPYRASDAYFRRVNNPDARAGDRRGADARRTIERFTNNAAATVVPAAAMARSQPVARSAQRVLPQQLATARPLVQRAPIAPTAATAGVTPAVARDLRLVRPRAGYARAPGPPLGAAMPGPRYPGAPALRAEAGTPLARPTLARAPASAPGPMIGPFQDRGFPGPGATVPPAAGLRRAGTMQFGRPLEVPGGPARMPQVITPTMPPHGPTAPRPGQPGRAAAFAAPPHPAAPQAFAPRFRPAIAAPRPPAPPRAPFLPAAPRPSGAPPFQGRSNFAAPRPGAGRPAQAPPLRFQVPHPQPPRFQMAPPPPRPHAPPHFQAPPPRPVRAPPSRPQAPPPPRARQAPPPRPQPPQGRPQAPAPRPPPRPGQRQP